MMGKNKRDHKKNKYSDPNNPNCGKHVVTLVGFQGGMIKETVVN